MSTEHRVGQGECISSIAAKYGLFPDTIWNYSANAELKEKRKNPNVLHPGDKLIIPEKDLKQESCENGQRHKFKRQHTQTLLRVILHDEDSQLLANTRYILTIAAQEFEGTTDQEGLIEQEIPADEKQGLLTVWLLPRPSDTDRDIINVDYINQQDDSDSSSSRESENNNSDSQQGPQEPLEVRYDFELMIGHLDPVEEIRGIQARLFNLGFDPGPIDGINGPLTRMAVERFQRAYDLQADGVPGQRTQDKLKELEGA